MSKAVTLADIAMEVGVSTVTVSKALSGQSGVSEQMRSRIIALAEELGYKQPSVLRREQAYEKSYHIGVLIQAGFLGKYESFYYKMQEHLSTIALANNCFVITEVLESPEDYVDELPKIVKERRVDGVILLGQLPTALLKSIKASEMPVVYLDFMDNEPDTDAVVSDNYYGGYLMTDYLLSLGHREIGYVGTVLATPSITDRYMGYLKALIEKGIQPREEWRIDDRPRESSYIDEEHLTLPENMPTAFFCNCDLTAGILIKKLKSIGLRVPEEISVVGYDNFIYPGSCDVEITTYEVNQREMAREAIHLIMNKIEKLPYQQGIHIVAGKKIIKQSAVPAS